MPDPVTDKRFVTLFISDEQSFGGSGNDIYPIRRFAGFYMTAADGLNCPGDVTAQPWSQERLGPLGLVCDPDLWRHHSERRALFVHGWLGVRGTALVE